MGRGMNPNRGKIKPEVRPNEVTLNLGPGDPLPRAPGGYKWKGRVSDQGAEWVAKWKDGITGEEKYVRFARKGQFKGKADLIKYEKARKLEMHIETVRAKYMADAASGDSVKMQLGTVLYLIDQLGIRVGNERGEAEAENIVGASTIKVENITIKSGYRVNLNFSGKDSIVYNKDLIFPPQIYDNLKLLTSDRPPSSQVFSDVSSSDINAYLKQFDKGFSAKVFRTRLASEVMYNALIDLNFKKGENLTKTRVKALFGKANAAVANILNHSRTIPPKAKENVDKDKKKLVEKRKELREKKNEGKSTKQLEKSIKTLMDRIENKTDTMAVAVGTSLQNYIDPRLVYSWVKTQADIVSEGEDEENIEANTATIASAVYTTDLRKTFSWAENLTEPGWSWMSSPLIGDPALEPAVDAPQPKPAKQLPKPSFKPKPPVRLPKPTFRAPTKLDQRTLDIIKEFVADHSILSATKDQIASAISIITRLVRLNRKIIKDGVITEEDLPDDQNLVNIGIDNSVLFSLLVELGPDRSRYGPGGLKEWQLLNGFCKAPLENLSNLDGVSPEVIAWVYPFSVYGFNNGVSTQANQLLMKHYVETQQK